MMEEGWEKRKIRMEGGMGWKGLYWGDSEVMVRCFKWLLPCWHHHDLDSLVFCVYWMSAFVYVCVCYIDYISLCQLFNVYFCKLYLLQSGWLWYSEVTRVLPSPPTHTYPQTQRKRERQKRERDAYALYCVYGDFKSILHLQVSGL